MRRCSCSRSGCCCVMGSEEPICRVEKRPFPDLPLGRRQRSWIACPRMVGTAAPDARPVAGDSPRVVPFLDAARGRATAHTPVWFMRQAGRSLPEYRALRGEGSILDAIKRPDLAAEITLQPVRRYGVDAAVLFSDIVVPSHAVGFGIDVAPGTGPVTEKPIRTAA